MPYTAAISRTSPACIVFVIDQSASMADAISGTEHGQRKCDVVTAAVNRMVYELCLKSAKAGEVRNYFEVGLIGFGNRVRSAFLGELANRDVVPLSEIAEAPARLAARPQPDDPTGPTTNTPVWMDPVADGPTPMCEALGLALTFVERFIAAHPGCFPPIVLHLTDGESTDGDPRPVADQIRDRASADGEVLLFNLHVSSGSGATSTFPSEPSGLKEPLARQLYDMSSPLPASMLTYAAQRTPVTGGARGFVYNADISDIVRFLDIGTRTTELR